MSLSIRLQPNSTDHLSFILVVGWGENVVTQFSRGSPLTCRCGDEQRFKPVVQLWVVLWERHTRLMFGQTFCVSYWSWWYPFVLHSETQVNVSRLQQLPRCVIRRIPSRRDGRVDRSHDVPPGDRLGFKQWPFQLCYVCYWKEEVI